MGSIFGTDGIRGIYGDDKVNEDMAFRLGKAFVQFLKRSSDHPKIIVGRDTRISGERLQKEMARGIIVGGGRAFISPIITTPGLSYLVHANRADGGVMITASHNPPQYNGFKFFNSDGEKLSRSEETVLENLLSDTDPDRGLKIREEAVYLKEATESYVRFLLSTIPKDMDFRGIFIILDCANGATSSVASELFSRLNIVHGLINCAGDGENINRGCGALYPDSLKEYVLHLKAVAGFSFDGDGDRVVAVDERGDVIDGDQTLIIASRLLKERGILKNNLVVSTIMSNMGLMDALRDMGLRHIECDVGDRNVYETMKAHGAVLGGEESGHIIFREHHVTGDGLLTSLQILFAMRYFNLPLSKMSKWMVPFPRVMLNVGVKKRPEINSVAAIRKVIEDAKKDLLNKGRVLVRYSGTEPVCRVMVEGKDRKRIDAWANKIADVIRLNLN